MTNTRKARIRRQRQRRALLTMALVLVVAFACIGGTIAWLTAQTGTVTNTFTVGNVTITLDEAPVGADGKATTGTRVTANEYKIIPGSEYDKDPTVTVLQGSEPCYLFVKFEEVNNPSTYYEYTSKLTIGNNWTAGKGTGDDGDGIPTNVWYRVVDATAENQVFQLLDGNKITVKDTVTKENMETAATAQLKWTAYAIQTANTGTVADAWAKLGA